MRLCLSMLLLWWGLVGDVLRVASPLARCLLMLPLSGLLPPVFLTNVMLCFV